jgi:hypothetical protein
MQQQSIRLSRAADGTSCAAPTDARIFVVFFTAHGMKPGFFSAAPASAFRGR